MYFICNILHSVCSIMIDIDIDIGTKHRLVAFKLPIIFIYFDSHCRFMDIYRQPNFNTDQNKIYFQ